MKHFRERGASRWIIFGLNVSYAEYVRSIDIGAGIPGLNSFEIGNGFGGFFREIQAKAEKLSGFGIIGILNEGALESRDRIAIVAFAIVSDTKFVREIFCRGIGIGNLGEGRESFIEFALLGEAMD